MDAQTPFHEKLKTLRKKHHFSQIELAERLHVSRQAVSLWETGKTYPDMANLVALCKLYNISTDELFEVNCKNASNQTDFQFVIKQLVLSIILTWISFFPIIGMVAPIVSLCFTYKKKYNFLFYLYVGIVFLFGFAHTYFFLVG